ncbi:F-box and associated interaction domains-containing protein [Rhynchospora pubera]|uniref:F-box and associated interaction domains-containing protein n=1 Tax=Rhynchospora pubera TaxID=906938 RepID=A0AAV8HXS3_9POAL|nr:F-box and associated interaction domains-containing protein [Rhynchospora pubera]
MKRRNEEIWCGVVLPDDVVVEILSRLHPKSFFRSKCVSKTWLALSSHAFRLNKHLQPTLMGFFYGSSDKSRPIGFANITGRVNAVDATLSLSALPHQDYIAILDCCNGLLLIVCWDFGRGVGVQRVSSSHYSYMYVYNPAIRKYIAVELIPEDMEHFATYTFSLAFDPQEHSRFHVVCFAHSYHEGEYINAFFTFSSDSGRWQQGGNMGCDLQITKSAKGTFLDGRVHRVTKRHEIVSVNPVDNSYLVTEFDFPALSAKGFSEIMQSEGRLHFMFLNSFQNMSIWVSENGNRQKWIFKHQISLHEVKFIGGASWHWNLKLHPEKDALIVHCKNGRIILIDLKTNESIEIFVLPNPKTYPKFWFYKPCYLV